MNANLSPQMPAINYWLTEATRKLNSVGVDTARLDAEILLANTLGKDRTYLHAHPEQIICPKDLNKVNSYLKKRLKRIPIAYILGHKEFYSRNFTVNPSVLIPRPETEEIVAILKSKIQNLSSTASLIDVGTGSGALGITAKLEFPHLSVTLTDISQKALKVATLNAKALAADVKCLKSDLLAKVKSNPSIILANLPYVDKKWACSPETAFEPKKALFAGDNGEALIKRLIIQASEKITPNGYLILECDPRQHKSLIEYAQNHSFKLIKHTKFVLAFQISKA